VPATAFNGGDVYHPITSLYVGDPAVIAEMVVKTAKKLGC
jgi:hypothetical protein